MNHTGMFCNCPSSCINCCAARLPAVGHVAQDLSCPLRKKYRRADNPAEHHANSSLEEGTNRPMAVDAPLPPTNVPVPSSQPEDNDDIGPSLFQRPSDRPVPPALMSFFADREKWLSMDFNSMSITELLNLPDLARAATISCGIKIPDIIHTKSSNLIANEQFKSIPNV